MDSMNPLSFLKSLSVPLVLVFSVWSYFQYSSFESAPDSEYGQKKAQLELAQKEIAVLERKNKEIQEFLRSLESKKIEISELSSKLLDLRTTLTDRVDLPEFTRTIVTEAKKTGLSVLAIRPKPRVDTEFYREYPFVLKFRGFYPQVFTFMNRIANMQRLVRLDQFGISPVSSASARFVELEGEVELKSFAYLSSQADKLAQPASAPEGSAKKGGS